MSNIFKTTLFTGMLALGTLPLVAIHADAKSSFMQECGAKWKAAKAAGTVDPATKWPDFMKTQCGANTDQPATQATAPAQPAPAVQPAKPVKISKKKVTAPVAPADTAAAPAQPSNNNGTVATVDKNGKPFTPGQIAAHQRIKQCAVEWHAAKSAGTLPQGEKWPQFWSACNTRLKG
jgi:hypothetical protein